MSVENVQAYRYWKIQFCLIYFVQHLRSESRLGEVDSVFMHMHWMWKVVLLLKGAISNSRRLCWGLPWSPWLSVLLRKVCINLLYRTINLSQVVYWTVGGKKSHLTQLFSFELCNSEHTRNGHSNGNWYILKKTIYDLKAITTITCTWSRRMWALRKLCSSFSVSTLTAGRQQVSHLSFTQMFRRSRGKDEDRVAGGEVVHDFRREYGSWRKSHFPCFTFARLG